MSAALRSMGKTLVDGLNRFAGWVLLLAIGWLCWGIARMLWLLLAPPQAPQLPLVAMQTKQAPTLNASTALTIFASNPPKPMQAALAPPNVELMGVMLATPNALSSAILMVEGNVANYRIGAMLKPTNYTLLDVTWNQAVIGVAGAKGGAAAAQQIVLDMPERMALDQSGESAAGSISNRRLPATNRRPAADAALPLPAPEDFAAAASNEDEGDSGANNSDLDSQDAADANAASAPTLDAVLDTAVAQLKQNPASYLSSMGVMATGNGYQVTEVMPAQIRKQLGLESGDRVLSVNGQAVGSNPAGDADLLNQVKRSGEATIEVQRGEQVITVRQQF